MALGLRAVQSLRIKGPSAKAIQASLLPMGPPPNDLSAERTASYYAHLARDQWREYSVAQRIQAWTSGKSLDLLSADVRGGMLTHKVPAVHPVLLVPTPSLSRSASTAFGRIEKGRASLVRALSSRKGLLNRHQSAADRVQKTVDAALAKPTADLKPSLTANSMVPSIFEVRAPNKSPRHVHFDETLPPSRNNKELQRSATDPVVKIATMAAANAAANLRPSRTLPPAPKQEFGFILITLDPKDHIVSPRRPSVATTAAAPKAAPQVQHKSLVPLPATKPLTLRQAAAPAHAIPKIKAPKRKPLTRDAVAQEMLDRLCLSLALA